MSKALKQNILHQRGFGITDLVIYLGILAVILVLVVSGIVQFGKVYAFSRSERRVADIAQTALERMVKELRLACNVTPLAGPNPGVSMLTYAGFEPVPTQACSTEFDQKEVKSMFLEGGRIKLRDSNNVDHFLTPTDTVRITDLTIQFPTVTTYVGSKAARIKLSVESGEGNYRVARTYYATAILRHSY